MLNIRIIRDCKVESIYLLTGIISIFHLSLSLIIQKVNFLFDHPTISKVEHAIPGKILELSSELIKEYKSQGERRCIVNVMGLLYIE